MEKVFQLHIYAAERCFYDGGCVSLTLPLPDGQLGILAGRLPLAAAVVPGKLTCRTPDGKELVAAVGGGFARFAHDDALVLLESAETPKEIDAPRAAQAAERAKAAVQRSQTPQQTQQAKADLARANNRLRLAAQKD